ncbi:MAG: hypothetical protein KJZ78_30095 [Bryobacteraceae bacterium]|nr:hypothetical protein [Bryobacteraceae bacterium]
MSQSGKVQDYLDRLPSVADLRLRLAANLEEAKLLRKLLRVAEQREELRNLNAEAAR